MDLPSLRLAVLYNCRRIFLILSFFVGYIFSFSLVRLRSIRLNARAVAHIECRCSCSRPEDVTITDVIIKNPDRKCVRKWGTGSFGDFWKKQLVEIRTWANPVGSTGCAARLLGQWVEIWRWTKPVDFWALARPVHLGLRDAPWVFWVWWNSQHSKNCVSLSSCRKPKLKRLINVSHLN